MESEEIDLRKRRSRAWDQGYNEGFRSTMNMTEVFETPDPEVTFQPYTQVDPTSRFGPEDAYMLDKTKMELDQSTIAPHTAFEVFMGKVYKPISQQTEYELPTTSSSLESPLQRYTRLVMEIKELETDLSLLASTSKSKVMVDVAQEAEYQEILSGIETLQLNLTSIEQNPLFQPFLQSAAALEQQKESLSRVQRDLTTKFFQQIEALKRTSHEEKGEKPPIVYEIYSNGELNAVDRDMKSRTIALEARLTQLEQLIGINDVRTLSLNGLSMTKAIDLTSIVGDLEKRVNLLNEKNLDAVKTRITALLHDFSMLHKVKDSSSVQDALTSQADREKIEHIYETLRSVQDVAATVPSLVDRLVALKSVHEQSVDMISRVQQMEQSQTTIQQVLESDTLLLQNIEKSMEENVKIFQANIQSLDERMTRLLHP